MTHVALRPIACSIVALVVTLATPAAGTEAEPDLGALLERLARVAELYRDSALSFACEETIDWQSKGTWHEGESSWGRSSGRQKFAYVYVHDDTEGFRNFRTQTGWMPDSSRTKEIRPDAPLYLDNALLWIFAFREERQPLHRYRIAGTGDVLGRRAVQIEFEPIPPIQYRVNDWHGTAWVDAETTQLLKVEAYSQEDHEEQARLQQLLARPDRRRVGYVRRHVTEYASEKNGLRFPSRLETRGYRVTVGFDRGEPRLEEKLIHRVDQTYRDYRFFSVRSEEEIGAFIAGGDTAEDD
jgi:hypothetical protein